MRTLTLTEWTPRTLRLEHNQTIALRGLHPRLEVRWDGPETWTVVSNGVVGAARVAGIDLVLQPRLPVHRVLWMLGYALKTPFIDHEATLAQDPSLVDAFADMYIRSLRDAMRRGLQMGYRTAEESLMTVRGRIRVADHACRRFGVVVPAEVVYDDYTTDTDANRMLKAALRRLGHMPLRSGHLRRRIASAYAAFATVSDIRFDPTRLPHIRFTRLNEHYRQPLKLAEIVLRSGSVDLNSGTVSVPALLFDMWRVFQDFLFEVLRPHMPPSYDWRAQAKLTLDDADQVRILPDLSLWIGRQCVAVGDAKYKHTHLGEDSDLYQLLAYCVAAGVSSGTLVYADGPAGGVIHQVRHGGASLEVFGLNLAASQTEIEAAVQRLASRFAPVELARAG